MTYQMKKLFLTGIAVLCLATEPIPSTAIRDSVARRGAPNANS